MLASASVAAKVLSQNGTKVGAEVVEGSSKAVQVQAPILKDFDAQRQVLNTFKGGKAIEKTYGEGNKLYRIGDRNGAYWSSNQNYSGEWIMQ